MRCLRARFIALLPACLALCAVATLGLTGEVKEEELEPVRIELPLPVINRGFQIKLTEHVEKPSHRPRPPFLAPKGTRNVALNKPVTSKDDDPLAGQLQQLTDGKKGCGKECLVELHPGKPWVQVDLQDRYNVHAVLVRHDYGTRSIYHDIVVQVADDADCITACRTLYNNDYDNTLGFGVGKDLEYVETHEGRLIPCKGVAGRYVRLYSNGSTAGKENHYAEVEVYATPAK